MPSHTAFASPPAIVYICIVNHELVLFQNGTHSLRQISTGQVMHSAIGARTEAKLLYFEPAEAALKAPGKKTVWDVGLGMGSNVLSVIDHLSPIHLNQIEFVSFENDLDGIKTALELNLEELSPHQDLLRTLIQTRNIKHESLGFQWRIIEGDFIHTLETDSALSKANVIFYDFYSPKNCPSLWSEDVFKKLITHCTPEAILLTYSSATHVRNALRAAGFSVEQGPSTPMKSETTKATAQTKV